MPNTRLSLVPRLCVIVPLAFPIGACTLHTTRVISSHVTAPAPQQSRRDPSDAFARLITSYTGERRIEVTIDPVADGTAFDIDVPIDTRQTIRQVLGRIGPPFVVMDAVERHADDETDTATSHDAAAPHFRLTVTMRRLLPPDEALQVRRPRADTVIPGAAFASRIEVTVKLTKVDSRDGEWLQDRVDLPDGPVVCHILQAGTPRQTIRWGSDCVATVASTIDAIIEATVAAATMQAFGRALIVPFYRSDARLPIDEHLQERVRSAFESLSRDQLEQSVRRFLTLTGGAMDVTALQVADRNLSVSGASGGTPQPLMSWEQHALVALACQLWNRGVDARQDLNVPGMVEMSRQLRAAAWTHERRPAPPSDPIEHLRRLREGLDAYP